MRKAVIDIGSNSVKLAIGELENEEVSILEFLKNIVALGKSSFGRGSISREVINQTVAILEKYRQKLKEYDVDDVRVIATTAIREAFNRDIFIDNVKRRTGWNVEILDVGDVIYFIESCVSHKLKQRSFPLYRETLLIAELGSGSLDISGLDRGLTLFNMGLPIGIQRLSQLSGEMSGSIREIHEAIADFIENEFSYLQKNIRHLKIDDVMLIDENYVRYLPAIVKTRATRENFFRITKAEVQKMIAGLEGKSADEIAERYRIPRDIAETITAYAIVLSNFCRIIRKNHVHILDISLCEAVLSNMLLNIKSMEKYGVADHLEAEARYLCERYDMDTEHSRHVADLCRSLWKGLQGPLGLEERDRVYLMLAAYLHDIGMFIYNRAHHKHTEYILRYLNVVRLSEEEKKIIACIARYHRKAIPRNSHAVYAALPYDKRIRVQKLSAILRIANALDCSHKQKVKKISIRSTRDFNYTLTVSTSRNFLLEKTEFLAKKKWFEEITGSTLNLVEK